MDKAYRFHAFGCSVYADSIHSLIHVALWNGQSVCGQGLQNTGCSIPSH